MAANEDLAEEFQEGYGLGGSDELAELDDADFDDDDDDDDFDDDEDDDDVLGTDADVVLVDEVLAEPDEDVELEEDDEIIDVLEVEDELDELLEEDDEVVPLDEGGRVKGRRATVEVINAGEFTCQSCFLVMRRSQLADPEKMLCVDCA